ncbi:gephyrin-like molybdotransferase Glp [Hydrogenophaga sp.]|uniref:molybdopterin molybdotransferase MoeA n=1 Tax=Hydrogenophaga sp. TaxID=1904254 RepID=UPI002716894A|nr:gephyrin-like molybdotransferase Glp [Hydrogenophaga sp.]MDO9438224.1 molybdopterin molybdotransferase MoeA [Hydrogenophaga sp.]
MTSIEQIATELQGYDPHNISAACVHAFLTRLVGPVTDSQDVAVLDALGRVLAQDVVSPVNVPPHDNSAMDGFAFDGAQLQAAQPLRLRVAGSALAGKAWTGTVGAGECVKIMTGAVMPAGLDTVVPIELAQRDGEQHILVQPSAVKLGDNRRLLGEDLRAGQPALRQGHTLSPASLGLVASLGLPTVRVVRRIKVAYFSTGDEILSLGDAPRDGAVYDSNRYTVFGLLTRLGVEVIDMGVVGDNPALLKAAFLRAAQQADAVITSGGVSMGDTDHTRAMMKQLGEVAFWRIAMRPGRPMAVGRIASADLNNNNNKEHKPESAVLFGLPGNPVAVMVTFLAFVRPALQRLMGATVTEPVLLRATSAEPLRKKPGRTEYQRGIVTRKSDGTLSVRSTGDQGSGVLRSMVEANGLVVLHHDQGNVAVGDAVDVMMFDGVL